MLLCVSFNLTNQVWNYFEFCAKHILCLRIIREIGWKSKFGKTGFKTCVLEKHFISYLCIFISYIKFFEVYFQKSGYFSEKMFFQIFDWSNLFFDQSKSFLKFLVSLRLVRLIEPIFQSIEHRESSFLKTRFWLVQTSFQNFSIPFFLTLRLGKAPQRFFCCFPPKFLQSFSLPESVCLFYPSFCIIFLIFMHFSHGFWVIFELSWFGIFD